MKKLSVALAALALVATSCMSGGPNERIVLVDFSHDEFSSFMIANFPQEVSVAAGNTVVFKQTWTGEPHTVTGGTAVNAMMEKAKYFIPLFEAFEGLRANGVDLPEEGERPDQPVAEVFEMVEESDVEPHRTNFLKAYDALVKAGSKLPARDELGDMTNAEHDKIFVEETDAIFEESGLPFAIDETEGGEFFVTQNAGQPCYLTKGVPPKDAGKPCADARQEQPAFDGTANYYNSGIIPYEGPQGNTFRVPIAADTKPGSYFFYCAVHGPSQYTEVKVRPEGSEVPAQEEVSRKARKEIADFAAPMLRSYRDARDGRMEAFGEEITAPFGGVATEAHGSINVYLPGTIRTRVGERVTWKMMGADHTVTFGVPEYFPIIQFRENGNVRLNPRMVRPAGGHPEIPEQEGEGVFRVDGGTYDGTGFYSSGLFAAEPYAEYSLRFSKPGTYKYACLLHPPMVGTVVVS